MKIRSPVLLASLGLIGVCLPKQWMIEALRLLPMAMTVRSMGSSYPRMDSAFGFPYQIKFLSLLLMLYAIIIWLGSMPRAEIFWKILRTKVARIPVLYVVVGLQIIASIFLVWINYPPNMFRANAMWHWVDANFFFGYTRYIYFLTAILHQPFYKYPHLYPVFINLLTSWVVWKSSREIFSSKFVAVLCFCSFLFSTNLLSFATPTEDTSLSVLTMLLIFYFYIKERYILTGVALFCAFLCRPSMGYLIGIVSICELYKLSENPNTKFFSWTTLRQLYFSPKFRALYRTFWGLLLIWNMALIAIGQHFILSPGKNAIWRMHNFIRTVDVDGFFITKFSGAYFLHGFWIFPITFWCLSIIGVMNFSKLGFHKKVAFVFLGTQLVIGLTFHEFNPLFYFNLRYLTYYFFSLLFMGWIAFESFAQVSSLKHTTLGILLCVSVMAPYTPMIKEAREIRKRVISELYIDRVKLSEACARCVVYLNEEKTASDRNWLQYIFTSPEVSIRPAELKSMEDGAFFLSKSKQSMDFLKEVYRSKNYFVYQVSKLRDGTKAKTILNGE